MWSYVWTDDSGSLMSFRAPSLSDLVKSWNQKEALAHNPDGDVWDRKQSSPLSPPPARHQHPHLLLLDRKEQVDKKKRVKSPLVTQKPCIKGIFLEACSTCRSSSLVPHRAPPGTLGAEQSAPLCCLWFPALGHHTPASVQQAGPRQRQHETLTVSR